MRYCTAVLLMQVEVMRYCTAVLLMQVEVMYSGQYTTLWLWKPESDSRIGHHVNNCVKRVVLHSRLCGTILL